MKALKLKDVNFYEQYTYNPERIKKRILAVRLAAPVVVVIAVLAGIVLMLSRSISALNSQIADAEIITNDTDLIGMSNDVRSFSSVQAAYDDVTSQLELYKKIVGSYHKYTSEDFEVIFSLMGSDITASEITYSMDTGMVEFTAASVNVNSIPEYIGKLRKSGLFRKVVYVGYSGDDGLEYTFAVGCIFNETVDTDTFDEFILDDSEPVSLEDDYSYLEP